jgi:hypothetical protein
MRQERLVAKRYRPFIFMAKIRFDEKRAEGWLWPGRGPINLYRGLRFLLECAVREDGLS